MSMRPLRLTAWVVAMLCALSCASWAARAEDKDTYTVEVDVTNQITTVYRSSNRRIVRQMICSTGIGGSTPLGVFRMEKSRPDTDRVPWYYITKYKCYVKYASRIKGPILFHSLPYAQKDMRTLDAAAAGQLGERASHGCIRLLWEDARWISEHCPDGTVVKIYTGAARKTGLRELLLAQGYTEDCRLSYSEFLDASPTDTRSGGLGRGARGDAVRALQERLVGLGFYGETPSGVYDEATTVAVMRYQAAAAETVTGIASRSLVAQIMSEDRLTAEYATLTPGCSGPLVSKVQVAMAVLGFYGAEIDGIYGDDLRSAVYGYCASTGMEVTQEITPALRCDIYGRLRTAMS